MYYQGVRDGVETERVAVDSLDAECPEGCPGYAKYVSLYSPEYHGEQPVAVRADDDLLVSMNEEIIDSLKIAVPILCFWVAVSISFVTYGRMTQ